MPTNSSPAISDFRKGSKNLFLVISRIRLLITYSEAFTLSNPNTCKLRLLIQRTLHFQIDTDRTTSLPGRLGHTHKSQLLRCLALLSICRQFLEDCQLVHWCATLLAFDYRSLSHQCDAAKRSRMQQQEDMNGRCASLKSNKPQETAIQQAPSAPTKACNKMSVAAPFQNIKVADLFTSPIIVQYPA